MINIRDFSNLTIVLIVIAVLACAFTARAVTTPAPPPQTWSYPPFTVTQLQIDPNMTFSMLPQNLNVSVGDTFTVTIAVENATDMYGWQVFLCFDSKMLECTGASLQSDNVFHGSETVCGALRDYNATEFTQGPLEKVQNDEGWILAGNCLLGKSQRTFYGSGVLCQVYFRAISLGSTTLSLLHNVAQTFQTFTLTSELTAMTAPSASYVNINTSPN